MGGFLEEFAGFRGYATLRCIASRDAEQFSLRTFRPDPKESE